MMIAYIRRPIAPVLALTGLMLTLMVNSVPSAHAANQDDNLPIYTSPIDITGLKVQIRAVAPDRDTGKPIDVSLPPGLSGPKTNELFSTPLSTQLDQYWSVNRDPTTGKTQREQACDGKDGIKAQVSKEISKMGSSYSAYDVSCNLASTGKLLVRQIGSTLYLGYLLTNNTVTFAVTTPYTCNANHGTFLCPNDPRFRVTFASEIVTVARTPSICQLNAESGTVNTQAVTINNTNGAGAIAKLLDSLFGHKFSAAERAIEAVERQAPLPLNDSFAELRASAICTSNSLPASLFRSAFRDFETTIDLRQGIILRAIHVGIAPPTVDVPNPGAKGEPSQPSFTRPMIATTQPLVTAGNAVQLNGQYFPLKLNLATILPVTMYHGGYGENSSILGGGICFNSATELQWGPSGGNLTVQRLQGDAQGKCADHFDAVNLTPATAYQFRARDCDLITCSPWSVPINVTTAQVDDSKGIVALTLDGGTPIGTTTVTSLGTFESTITIPASTSAGEHTIHAVSSNAKADVTLQVAAPAGGKGSIMIVGRLKGETGCPNHPITSTQTDDTFTLFGAGFATGTVAIHLDSAIGAELGMATVQADGSICQQMQGVPGSSAGVHTLVAVQNGTVQAQTIVSFVLPSVIR